MNLDADNLLVAEVEGTHCVIQSGTDCFGGHFNVAAIASDGGGAMAIAVLGGAESVSRRRYHIRNLTSGLTPLSNIIRCGGVEIHEF